MCEPTTIMFGLSVAMAGVSAYAQTQTAKGVRQATEVQAENERQEAHDVAEENLGVKVREAREQRARARVAAGESGAMGASFAASINQNLMEQDNQAALISKGLAFNTRGIDDRANTSLAQSRGPSALESGLSIATAGAQGWAQGRSIEALKSGKTIGGRST